MKVETLVITPEMLSFIAEIEEFKGAWRAIGRLAPERLRELRKIATIESVGSSTRIEGAKLSDREVEELLGRVQARSFASRDEQEVAGYAALMETVFSSYQDIPVTENHIKQLHALLLRYSDKDARHRGEYKKLSNQVQAFDVHGHTIGVVFETASPFDTPRRVEDLLAWHRITTESKSLHPLVAAGIFIVVFLAIHPFQDGNGRLSRALTTLLLLKSGYAYVPYCSLESIVEENKEEYYLALRRTQATLTGGRTDWLPWLTFFLRTICEQKRRLETKIERERILRASLPELALTILDLAAEHGEISVAGILRATNSPRGTIRKRLSELERAGHLKRSGKGRGSRYTLA